MAKTWSEVSTSDQFLELDDASQQQARDQYFTSVIAPQVPEQDQDSARQQFMSYEPETDSDIPSEDVGRLQTAGGKFLQGFGGVVSSVPKSLAITREQDVQRIIQGIGPDDPSGQLRKDFYSERFDKLDRGEELGASDLIDPYIRSYEGADTAKRQELRTEIGGGLREDPQEDPIYKAGEDFDQWMTNLVKVNPEYAKEFWAGKVPQGFGSMTGFMAAAVISRAPMIAGGASPMAAGLAGSAGLGAMAGGTEGFEDALQSGASLSDAFESYNLNAAVGTSEALPIAHILNKLDKSSGGTIRKTISDMLVQGTEEAIQEAFQAIMGNLIASDAVGYDPDRKWWGEAKEGSEVGFTTGAIMSLLSSMVAGRRGSSGPGKVEELDPSISEGLDDNMLERMEDAYIEKESVKKAPRLEAPVPRETPTPDADFVVTPEGVAARPRDVAGEVAAAEPAVEPELKRKPVQQPFEYRAGIHEEKAAELGLTPEQREAFKPEDIRDTVTGFYKAEDRAPALERAQKHVEETGEVGHYVEADIRNLGGLNAKLGHSGADRVYRGISDRFQKHLQESGGDVVTFRHGGDEISAVVVNATQKQVESALAKASEDVDSYIETEGLSDLPHAKDPTGSPPGVGLYFGVGELVPGGSFKDSITIADRIVETKKEEGKADVIAGKIRPVGIEPSGEQAEGIERGVEPGPEQVAIEAREGAAEVQVEGGIDAQANEAATSPLNDLPDPTNAQIESGNYKKGHVSLHGLDIAIENPKGSTRSGTDPDGKPWSVDMPAHYGYIKRTEGADNEQVDVYVGDKPENDMVFVVDQNDLETGEFDEHKVIMAVSGMPEAVKLYQAGFSDGRGKDRIGKVTPMTMDEFKEWLKGDTTQPISAEPEEVAPAEPEKVKEVPEVDVTKEVEPVEEEAALPEGHSVIETGKTGLSKWAVIEPDGSSSHKGSTKENAIDSFIKGKKFEEEVALRTAEQEPEVDRETETPAEGRELPGEVKADLEKEARKTETAEAVSLDVIDEAAYEQRPDQSESDISNNREAARESAVLLRGVEGTLLGASISKDFKDQSSASLIGKKITSSTDLAVLGQIYRSPAFETLRYFYMKDGVIVHQTGVSSRLAGGATLFSTRDGTMEDGMDALKADMESYGADGVYMLHNHPSGNPNPSDTDIRATKGVAGKVTVHGHIIVNHTSYAHIDSDGEKTINDLPVEAVEAEGRYLPDTPTKEHPLLGAKVESPESLASLGAELRDQTDYFQIIGTDIKGVKLIYDVPVSATRDKGLLRLLALVRRVSRETGSNQLFAVNVPAVMQSTISTAIEKDVLTDAIGINKQGTAHYSYRATGIAKPEGGFIMGRVAAKGYRVEQPVFHDYRGEHEAPMREDSAPGHDLTGGGAIYPDDVYTHGIQYYGTGDSGMDSKSFAIAYEMKGRPNKPVTIYRAVPYEKDAAEQLAELEGHISAYMRRGRVPSAADNGLSGSDWVNDAWERKGVLQERVDSGDIGGSESIIINPGDWVTINRNYAKDHGISALNGKYKIISKKVKAKDIYTNGDSIHEWGYDPSEGFVREPTGEYKPENKRPWYAGLVKATHYDKAVKAMQDRFQYLYKAQREIKRVRDVKELPDYLDAYSSEIQYHGKVKERLDRLHDDYIQPLEEMIVESGVPLEDIETFLHARHAKEVNAKLKKINPYRADNEALSGMTDAEADLAMNTYADNEVVQRIGAHVDVMAKRNLDILLEDKMISQEAYDAMINAYEHYVPLMRVDKGEGMPTKGRGYQAIAKIKRRFGSTKDVANILPNFIAKMEAGIISGEKAKVGRVFMNLVRTTEDPNFWQVDVEKFRPYEKMDHELGHNVVAFAPDSLPREDEFMVRVGDDIHRVSANPKNEYAMGIIRAMKNLDGEQLNMMNQKLMTLNRYLSSINTSLSPEFVISNFTRDIQTAFMNLSDSDADKAKAQVMRDVIPAMAGIRRVLYKGKKAEGEWAQHWRDFEKAGARTGWVDNYRNIDHRRSEFVKEINLMREGAWPATKRAAKALFEIIDNENTAVENAVRLAAFKSAKDIGMSEQKAAVLAKELTVNFNRKGDYGSVMNSLYLFFNASIQGSARLIIAGRKSPKVRKLMGGMVLFAAVLDMVNRSMGGDDEDGVPHYDKIDNTIKDRNIIIMNPDRSGDYAKLPAPWGYNVFHIIGQEAGRWVDRAVFDKGDPQATPIESASRLVLGILDAFNPVQSGTLLQTAAPTVLDPYVMYAENKSWHGGDLKPEGGGGLGKDTPESERYFSSARKMSIEATKWLNAQTGGSEFRPGGIDISPEVVDMMIDTATGSAGRFYVDLVDSPLRALSGETVDVKRIPLLRKLYSQKNVYFDKSRFWGGVNDVLIATKEAESEVLETRKTAIMSRKLGLAEYYNDELKKPLKEIRKQRTRIRANEVMTDAAKEKILDNLQERELNMMGQFNKRYNKVVVR